MFVSFGISNQILNRQLGRLWGMIFQGFAKVDNVVNLHAYPLCES